MKKFLLALLLPLILAGSFATVSEIIAPPQAEAARFGSGRSFGSRPAFQRPTQAPTRSPAQQQNLNRTAGATAQPRGGFLGPLLAGSMLGALFFGGAFSGIGMMDIMVIMLGVYLLTSFLRSRRQAAQSAQSGQSGQSAYGQGAAENSRGFARSSSDNDPWARMRSGQSGAQGASQNAASGIHLPEDFDMEDFLSGAKVMFTRLQQSWDSRDISDIEDFTSPAIVEEIKRQAAEDPTPSRTDIIMINAELADFDQGSQFETASVHFNVLLREYAGQDVQEINEIWHFIRPASGGTWKLDGIQQVAD